MAKKPVFTTSDEQPFVNETQVEFKYYNGFAISQKQKTIQSLHDSYIKDNPQSKIIEISSKSKDELGVKLSAFNLMLKTKTGKEYSVESVFQSCKVFEKGGPFTDLLEKSSKDAKKDDRLKNSGKLINFTYNKYVFSLNPTTYFYNWLYINTLNLYPDLCDAILYYDAFTDIVFNPEKSINCQAKAIATYVSLRRKGLLSKALESKESFLKIVYPETIQTNSYNSEQLTIWDYK